MLDVSESMNCYAYAKNQSYTQESREPAKCLKSICYENKGLFAGKIHKITDRSLLRSA